VYHLLSDRSGNLLQGHPSTLQSQSKALHSVSTHCKCSLHSTTTIATSIGSLECCFDKIGSSCLQSESLSAGKFATQSTLQSQSKALHSVSTHCKCSLHSTTTIATSIGSLECCFDNIGSSCLQSESQSAGKFATQSTLQSQSKALHSVSTHCKCSLHSTTTIATSIGSLECCFDNIGSSCLQSESQSAGKFATQSTLLSQSKALHLR
jgi:hypothetical protein